MTRAEYRVARRLWRGYGAAALDYLPNFDKAALILNEQAPKDFLAARAWVAALCKCAGEPVSPRTSAKVVRLLLNSSFHHPKRFRRWADALIPGENL